MKGRLKDFANSGFKRHVKLLSMSFYYKVAKWKCTILINQPCYEIYKDINDNRGYHQKFTKKSLISQFAKF